ncbi:glycosyltransferase family 4 protein [Corynebacterium bovis]|uniref:Phosphatidylinositol alpha-1,6-mannosyltransferase n=1 Tax=Corynebacterium bovis DSM 20582 = CIP 54.80 TaxID=927655 RepID=A0A8H9Y946_9CORY|nr:glycosyltransferase family 4 protein [Corynebacterium bovis]MBB3115027.1 phosphatidylinositol alpha-1,6-mannosyltransferase [Corynebacterium bovis DSM 20582 = CIP 54.80]QQC47987.1 glycosyltransferase family 4 protein [Corynebacterium bovis]RRO82006.1 glycosyltransferase family 1 protein [Corynebacterium bovis]RRO83773.1 glycosyltransferase family 1 protein [Corynebacterium bovis]RRO85035.1 glycosyltransferase family 1 protein [Corynebacterium bovis]
MATSGPRVLLVTNDFPPTLGGIQSYLRDYCGLIDPDRLTVFASTQDREAARRHDAGLPYRVVRWPRRVMLPTPATGRAMADLIRAEGIDTVWFGSSTPLGLLAGRARAAGATRVIASTHGHEVGWSMVPGGRAVLRRIGRDCDCLTFVSRYARRRFASAFGPDVALEPLPGGVDTARFHPDPDAAGRIRARYGVPAGRPLVVCVSRIVPRKGQDTLVEAMPGILRTVPDAHLLVVGPGGGPDASPREYGSRLACRAGDLGVADHVTFTGPVPPDDLVGAFSAGDVFAMPVRTRAGGFSVEGLGIVFLEAQACGVPTVAGDGGGAPETVVDGVTGDVVDGRDTGDVARTVAALLDDAARRRRYGRAGRDHMVAAWDWEVMGRQFRAVLAGDGRVPPRHSWTSSG